MQVVFHTEHKSSGKMIKQIARSIRPFIGSRDFDESRRFYTELGFEETVLAPNMSLFKISEATGFYLQDAYVEDWINNTMVFLEVEDVDEFWNELHDKTLSDKFPGTRLLPVRRYDWGRECFLHDPSGILWHFGEFGKKDGEAGK